MTNEWEEYLAYTLPPVYSCKSKSDNTYLGRFTIKMILENIGFSRIFTILARGFLFHNTNGSIKDDDPYERAEEAKQMLCAWCSVPDNGKATLKEWQFTSDFRELHEKFPELVGADGYGWYARHIHDAAEFIAENQKIVRKSSIILAEKIDDFDNAWRNQVIHYLVPIFSENTKGEFVLRFDDVIADALEQGPLRTEEYRLTKEQTEWVDSVVGLKSLRKAGYTLLSFYLANKPADSDWVVLPQMNFDAYFGNTNFSKNYVHMLPTTFFERHPGNCGVSMYRIKM